MLRRIAVLLPLACVLAAPAAGAAPRPAAIRARTIASLQTADYRGELSAVRVSGGAAPTATVTLEVDVHRSGSWHRTLLRRLSGTWFWNTVTAPRGVCRLDLVEAPGAPKLTVQLLQSPSLGCGRAQRIALPRS
jgi:hypothetical protein